MCSTWNAQTMFSEVQIFHLFSKTSMKRKLKKMLEVNEVIDNRFKLLSKLGAGEFGSVWKVEDVEDGKEKALKMCPKDDPSYLKELKFLNNASHVKGVSKLLFNFHFQRWSCLVLSLEGESFDQIMQRSKNPGVSTANLRRIMYNLGQTLVEIHNLGFIHRDLHAQNILVTVMGEICALKIVDFGVCLRYLDYIGNELNQENNNNVNFITSRHSSLQSMQHGYHIPQDDWISLIYILIHYNGVRFRDDIFDMMGDKMNFGNNPHSLLRPDLHWLADCYQLLQLPEVDFQKVLEMIDGDESDFDVKSPIEFEMVDGVIKFN
ncbi:hypothetical protein L5515_016350 [Caenorhabditis briggsae]|uniref:Protein kinase domain-containing protein n=3 Tax=Caenorhabditis briggsae TaxID=6238 RepID=A0AAE9JP79_CAEBR|nr:hypothetical protein L5515_016350 [Caenorhabditis briggsae]